MQPLALLEKTVQQDHLIARRDGDTHFAKNGLGFLAQRLDVFRPTGELGQCTIETLSRLTLDFLVPRV